MTVKTETVPDVAHEDPASIRIEFDSGGDTVVGRLHPAAFADGPAPAVAILGPMTFQKEQAPAQYARRLADLGYTALTFDPRYRGESGGEPRCFESPHAKGDDLRAALGYLADRPDVDADRLAVLGICMGASHVLPVAAGDLRVRAVATVAGHYRDPRSDVAWLGTDDAVAHRRARGMRALADYRDNGQIEYVPAVDPDRLDVGMPGEMVWDWYHRSGERGEWENRYAVMSDAAMFSFESISAAARLATPWLMVHSDASAVPDAAQRHFAVAPTDDKKLQWDGSTRHFQYYDDPVVIDRTTGRIVDWFARHLLT